MRDGEIHAWHYATRQPVIVGWRDGIIHRLEPASGATPPDLWIAPPLVDLQVNGYGGVDFQQDDLDRDDLVRATERLEAAGCGRFLLTLVTDQWPKLTARLQHLKTLRAQSHELQTRIAGWHLEGPFLSSEPGFHGAHDPNLMCNPTPGHLERLRAIAGADPLLLTLAPERPGALEAIAYATSLGIKVSLGHTNASADQLRRAVQAGASAFTHLGNACPRLLDRHDNILWRVLDLPELAVSLIPDGIHVAPALFRLLHRVLNPAAIFYVTDAMAAAGAGPGRYTLGKLQPQVGPDGIVRQPGQANFAGSALRPIDGIFRAARMLNRPWQELWPYLSTHPARFMGWPADLQPGTPADFCLLRAPDEGQPATPTFFRRGHPHDLPPHPA